MKPWQRQRDGRKAGNFFATLASGKQVNLGTQDAALARKRAAGLLSGDWRPPARKRGRPTTPEAAREAGRKMRESMDAEHEQPTEPSPSLSASSLSPPPTPATETPSQTPPQPSPSTNSPPDLAAAAAAATAAASEQQKQILDATLPPEFAAMFGEDDAALKAISAHTVRGQEWLHARFLASRAGIPAAEVPAFSPPTRDALAATHVPLIKKYGPALLRHYPHEIIFGLATLGALIAQADAIAERRRATSQAPETTKE